MIPSSVLQRFATLQATQGAIPNQHCFNALRTYVDGQNFADEAAFELAMQRLANDDVSEWTMFRPVFSGFLHREPTIVDTLVIKQIISRL